MGVNSMQRTIKIAFIVFIGIQFFNSSTLQASGCNFIPHDLDTYFKFVKQEPDSQKTTLYFDSNGNTKNITIKILKAGHTERILSNITLSGSIPIVKSDGANTVSYLGIIIPPEASKVSVRLDKPIPMKKFSKTDHRINAFATPRYRFESSSLGANGAIVLVKMDDYKNCKNFPLVHYLLPKSSNINDTEILSLAIHFNDDSWKELVTSLMKANGNYLLQGNDFDELLDQSAENSTTQKRRSLLQKAAIIKIPKELDKALFPNNIGDYSKRPISIPVHLDWMQSIEKMVQPPEITQMREFTNRLMPFLVADYEIQRLLQEGTIEQEKLENHLSVCEKLLVEAQPLKIIAQEGLEKYKKNVEQLTNQEEIKREILLFEAMQRELGGFISRADILQKNYEALYATVNKIPPMQSGKAFNEKQLLSADLSDPKLPKKLTVQSFSTPNLKASVAGKSLSSTGTFYVVYRPFKDPVHSVRLYRPHIYWVGDTSDIHRIHKQLVGEHLPQSSCRHRYGTVGDFSTYNKSTYIKGDSTVKYEKWFCEDHYWICFNGWWPRECRNHIKTRLFRVDQPLSFTLFVSLINQSQLKFTLRSNFLNDESIFNMDFDKEEFWETIDDSDITWESVSFTHDIENRNKLLLLLKGRGKALRKGSICYYHDMIHEKIIKN